MATIIYCMGNLYFRRLFAFFLWAFCILDILMRLDKLKWDCAPSISKTLCVPDFVIGILLKQFLFFETTHFDLLQIYKWGWISFLFHFCLYFCHWGALNQTNHDLQLLLRNSIQPRRSDYIWLLNDTYENKVTLREQNLS